MSLKDSEGTEAVRQKEEEISKEKLCEITKRPISPYRKNRKPISCVWQKDSPSGQRKSHFPSRWQRDFPVEPNKPQSPSRWKPDSTSRHVKSQSSMQRKQDSTSRLDKSLSPMQLRKDSIATFDKSQNPTRFRKESTTRLEKLQSPTQLKKDSSFRLDKSQSPTQLRKESTYKLVKPHSGTQFKRELISGRGQSLSPTRWQRDYHPPVRTKSQSPTRAFRPKSQLIEGSSNTPSKESFRGRDSRLLLTLSYPRRYKSLFRIKDNDPDKTESRDLFKNIEEILDSVKQLTDSMEVDTSLHDNVSSMAQKKSNQELNPDHLRESCDIKCVELAGEKRHLEYSSESSSSSSSESQTYSLTYLIEQTNKIAIETNNQTKIQKLISSCQYQNMKNDEISDDSKQIKRSKDKSSEKTKNNGREYSAKRKAHKASFYASLLESYSQLCRTELTHELENVIQDIYRLLSLYKSELKQDLDIEHETETPSLEQYLMENKFGKVLCETKNHKGVIETVRNFEKSIDTVTCHEDPNKDSSECNDYKREARERNYSTERRKNILRAEKDGRVKTFEKNVSTDTETIGVDAFTSTESISVKDGVSKSDSDADTIIENEHIDCSNTQVIKPHFVEYTSFPQYDSKDLMRLCENIGNVDCNQEKVESESSLDDLVWVG